MFVMDQKKKDKVDELVAGKKVRVIFVENTRQALSDIASRFYEGQPDHVAAVTGTSGKSSTVWFVRQILEGLGYAGASLGTIGLHARGLFEKSALTTADPVSLHKTLSQLSEKQIDYLAMEASSIGVEQCRMDGVKIKVAAFTNFSHEHLDYHENMGEYFKAKQRLFTHCLDRNGVAVLNADIPEYKKLSSICDENGIDHISYGIHASGLNTVKLVNRSIKDNGQNLVISLSGQKIEFSIPLIGSFQAQNILCAIAIVCGLLDKNIDIENLVKTLPTMKTVPGRLERIDGHPQGASVYVDYAHKPDALEAVLKAVRPHTKGKLWVVFGCGGDRDRSKRSMMAKISYDLADEVIVTDDNPRNENPADIRAEITDGFPSLKNIGDRREAIDLAMSSLQMGDSLIIAGKGHESGQTIQAQTLPFDDRDEARQSIQSLVKTQKENSA
ncbi:MAG: UDP-N-acetylmuramoyl-L-alanyl-D-glutamate--2,6-diaminopimelate ligase [Bdellovibrionales bacterium]